MTPAEDGRRRYPGLDGLRGIGAVCVILLHVWLFEYADAEKPAKRTIDLAIGELRLVLPMFFVLSGFLLVRPWLKAAAAATSPPSTRTYLRRRAARILPGYWAALAGSVFLVWGADDGVMAPVDHLPLFLVFAQNFDIDTLYRVDPPMWTLAVEVSFYLTLPLLGWLFVRARSGPRLQLLVCMLLVIGGVAFNTWAERSAAWPTLTASLLSQLPYFAFGMAAAVLVLRRTVGPRTKATLVIAGLALVIGDAVWHIHTDAAYEHWITDLPAGVGFAMIIAATPAVLNLLPFRVLGKLSYGLYLWHFPIIVWLRLNDLWPGGGLLVSFTLVLIPTTLIAALSWRWLERPAIAWSHREPRRRPPARPEPVEA